MSRPLQHRDSENPPKPEVESTADSALRKPTIEYLIAAYNEQEHIVQAVSTLLEGVDSSDRRVLVSVSDNCSSDATVQRLEHRFKGDSRVCLSVQPRNIGAHANALWLLSHATGEFVAFVGAHDRYSSNFTREALSRIESQTSRNVVWFASEVDLDAVTGRVEPGLELRLHSNPRLRFWQLVLFLHRATIVQALYPSEQVRSFLLDAADVYTLDHLFIHIGLRSCELQRIPGTFYIRRHPERLGSGYASRNSAGEVQTRRQRLEGDLSRELNDAELPRLIAKQAPPHCSRAEVHLARYLLGGKYRQGWFRYIAYRLTRRAFTLGARGDRNPTAK